MTLDDIESALNDYNRHINVMRPELLELVATIRKQQVQIAELKNQLTVRGCLRSEIESAVACAIRERERLK